MAAHAEELLRQPCFLTYESDGLQWGELFKAFSPTIPTVLLMLREPRAWTDLILKHDWDLLHLRNSPLLPQYGHNFSRFAEALVQLGCFQSSIVSSRCQAAGQTRDYKISEATAALLDNGLTEATHRLKDSIFGITERYGESRCLISFLYGVNLPQECQAVLAKSRAEDQGSGDSKAYLHIGKTRANSGYSSLVREQLARIDYGAYAQLYAYALQLFDSRVCQMPRDIS